MFEFSLQKVLRVFEGGLEYSGRVSRVIGRKVFVNPDLAVALIVKADHSIVDPHRSTFLIGSFITLERAVEDVEALSLSELRSIG